MSKTFDSSHKMAPFPKVNVGNAQTTTDKALSTILPVKCCMCCGALLVITTKAIMPSLTEIREETILKTRKKAEVKA